MKGLGQSLILVASLAGPVSAAEPGVARWRTVLGNIEVSIPSTPIKNVAIAPNKGTQGGDVVISFADGTTHRLEAQGYAQAAQLAPDGQPFGFSLIEYYNLDTNGDLLDRPTRHRALSQQQARVRGVPEKQATAGWAFRDGGESSVVTAPGTHGPTYMGFVRSSDWERARDCR